MHAVACRLPEVKMRQGMRSLCWMQVHPRLPPTTMKPAPDPHAVHPHLSFVKLAPEVLAKVGETFATGLFAVQRRLAELGAGVAPPARSALDGALAEVARLEQLGVRLQAIARELAGDGRVEMETLDLAAAARQALAASSATAARRGVTMAGPTEPVLVHAVAAVLEQLLDLALDFALRLGDKVTVSAALQGIPAHPALMVRVERAGAAVADAGGAADELAWLLFASLARASALAPQRLAVGPATVLVLGFPPMPCEHAVTPPGAPCLPHTSLTAGRQVLILEPREFPRVQAHRLLHDVGMAVDAVATPEQAHAALRDRAPDVLVTGLPIDDPSCAAFVDEARVAQPRLRVIELVDDDDAFAFSLPGSEHAGRVGRSAMARTLVQAVSQEADAAWVG